MTGYAKGQYRTVRDAATVPNCPLDAGLWTESAEERADAECSGMTARTPLPYHLAKGSFATADAAAQGISQSRLRAADLDAPFRGVRTVGLDLDELTDRCRAAEAFMDDREAFSHSTALGVWGAPLPSDLAGPEAALHIGTRGSTRRRRDGIIGHRLARSTPVAMTPDGIVTVAPATAWCQFASQQGDRSRREMLLAVVCVADFLITGRRVRGRREPRICTPSHLRSAVLAHGAGRGARILSDALTLMRSGVDSPKETELRLLLAEANIAEAVIGHIVPTRLGSLEPDLAYPERRVLIEYEGDQHREDRRQWRGDFERVRAFQQAGWTVIRVNSDDLSDEARRAALIAQIRALLA